MKYTTTKLYKSGNLLLANKEIYVFLYLQRVGDMLFMCVYGKHKMHLWTNSRVIDLDIQILFQ